MRSTALTKTAIHPGDANMATSLAALMIATALMLIWTGLCAI